MRERRKTPRVHADDEGLIIVEGKRPIACRLSNRSADGVWLWVQPASGVPDSFRIELPATGEALNLTVVWRRPSEIGARLAAEDPICRSVGMPEAA